MNRLFFIIILSLGLFLRLYHFNSSPPGFYVDEASLGYNAYSLLRTGADEYGQEYPIFFRSFGTYQSGLYVYLSTLPISIFGLNIFSTRLVSLIAGLILIFITHRYFGLLASLFVAITPIFVFYSRAAFEANLALTIFISGLMLSLQASKSKHFLPLGFSLLALSGYAYHGQRFLSVVCAVLFVFQYLHQHFNLKTIIISSLLFLFIQLPLLQISLSSGANSRLLGLLEFDQLLSRGLAYFSPLNLFSQPDPELQRSFTDLSVFYWWMFLPFIFSYRFFLRHRFLIIVAFLSVLPAILTREYFSTLRALPFFYILIIGISSGWRNLTGKYLIIATCLFTTISVITILSSINLLTFERNTAWNYGYRQLFTTDLPKGQIVVDTTRFPPLYSLYAFFTQLEPRILQVRGHDNYYQTYNFPNSITLNNIDFRPVDWRIDAYRDQHVIGDPLLLSPEEIKEHLLDCRQNIKGPSGNVLLLICRTNPTAKTASDRLKLIKNK